MQALLAARTLHLARRALLPLVSAWWPLPLLAAVALVSALPWLVSQLMPDLFTGLLVLALGLLAFAAASLSRRERIWLIGFMIATHQSHLPLTLLLVLVALPLRYWLGAGALHVLMYIGTCPGATRATPRPRSTRETFSPPAPRETLSPGGAGRETLWTLAARLLAAPVLACVALVGVNLVGHHRVSGSPFGNVFVLACMVYDGP